MNTEVINPMQDVQYDPNTAFNAQDLRILDGQADVAGINDLPSVHDPVAAQNPFGINQTPAADKFAGIRADSLRPTAADYSITAPKVDLGGFKAPTAAERAQIEDDVLRAQIKKAARAAVNAAAGYDTEAALAESIATVNAQTERERKAAEAALVEREQRDMAQRLIDEQPAAEASDTTTTTKKKSNKSSWTLAA
jgi:hypothetical protein